MPTYSYQCNRCDHIQDVFHSMSATPQIKCTECGGKCKKLLGTGAGIIFKGSGFYETDYKKKGKAPASDTASTATKAEPKSSGDSTGKPAAKGEAKTASTKVKTE